MSNDILFVGMLLVHWLADFVCQTDEDAKNKSKNIMHLLNHTITYSFIWLGIITMYVILTVPLNTTDTTPLINILLFTGVTFVFHTVTDFFTSKLNAKLWGKGDVHNFFVSIGFDQVLHYAQLYFTFKYLFL